jgi:hypothetical protein
MQAQRGLGLVKVPRLFDNGTDLEHNDNENSQKDGK